jgi:DNA helicase-2/ATP-dependent DNA helicase PcrA
MPEAGKLPDYLSVLNPEQLEAVRHEGSPLLILAGAGSGKTRVITTKIAYLIRERAVDPESILAVTFTNKAAREMSERACRIEPRSERAVLRTFHSFGAWFLRRNGGLLGLDSRFVIYDDDDSTTLLSAIMEETPRAQVARTAHLIARAKDYFLDPDSPGLSEIDHRSEFRDWYRQYEERLRKTGNVDFGDLIKLPAQILRTHPEVSQRFRQRFRVVLVDEYQDSNVAQFELLKELCGPDTYLCVVGDDDQSIYRFRGAEVRNILDFPDRFPGTAIVRLERNYRSTAPILAVAGGVVDRNQDRLGKTLSAVRGDGKTPTLAFLPDQDAEASFCAELVERSVSSGARCSDWAILYRTNAQSLGFETEFLRRRIPYRVVGSLKFYEREEVKDALALLAFSLNPRDEVAFRRVVNKPARGVGGVTVERIVAESVRPGTSALGDLAAASLRLQPSLSAKARTGLAEFLRVIAGAAEAFGTMIDSAPAAAGAEDAAASGAASRAAADSLFGDDAGTDRGAAAPEPRVKTPGSAVGRKAASDALSAGEGLSSFVVQLVVESGLSDHHRAQDEIAGTQRLANLQELANAASLYPPTAEGLAEFLEHIELDRAAAEVEDSADSVTLITLHNTKGLEFRRVVMTGLEQGVFPRDDKKDDDLEEERRLFYVGATRAMDELYLCACARRRLYGRTVDTLPSLFLGEIPSGAVRIVGRPPYGFSADRPGAGGAGSAGIGSAGPRLQASADGLWRVGGRVFHDDYGYGGILSVRESDEGPVVVARFESGKEFRFLPRFQSKSFMRIGSDD